jgi:hypothetical protein
MFFRALIVYFLLLTLFMVPLGCKNKKDSSRAEISEDSINSTEVSDTNNDYPTVYRKKKSIPDSIVGDTVWIRYNTTKSWFDTLITTDYSVRMAAWIDTTDYLTDTVNSSKGNRIVAGYNYFYTLEFLKGNKSWFIVSFNKKKDLISVLDGTELWLESNLDVFSKIIYNTKYNQFIVELNIKSHSGFDLKFYLIIDTKGAIIKMGTARNWGGENPDGEEFLTENNELYVTCSEIYNFKDAQSLTLSEYVSLAELKSNMEVHTDYLQIHGLRNLSDNHFLVVFNRSHGQPTYNAFILSADTSVCRQFSYFGIIEEMDAVMLYDEPTGSSRAFLYDTEREKLICIDKTNNFQVKELGINDMKKCPCDTCNSSKLHLLDFSFYGSYEFYVSTQDSTIYYKSDTFH